MTDAERAAIGGRSARALRMRGPSSHPYHADVQAVLDAVGFWDLLEAAEDACETLDRGPAIAKLQAAISKAKDGV